MKNRSEKNWFDIIHKCYLGAPLPSLAVQFASCGGVWPSFQPAALAAASLLCCPLSTHYFEHPREQNVVLQVDVLVQVRLHLL